MWIMWWYTQVFEGNSDHTTPVTSLFARGVRANYIRIRPTEWQGYISFRFEILGCNGELIVTRPISTIISTSNNRTGLDMLWDLTSSIQHFQKFLLVRSVSYLVSWKEWLCSWIMGIHYADLNRRRIDWVTVLNWTFSLLSVTRTLRFHGFHL